MTPLLAPLLGLVLLLQPADPPHPPDPAADPATALRDRVMQRAGIEAWPQVARLQFTFNVDSDGSRVAEVRHDWDLVTGVDTVTWNKKTVPVNIRTYDADTASEDEKAAFARWTNDSYWLLMPLKLADPGVTVRHEGESEVEGESYQTLRLSFENVGLTPGDQYLIYVDDEGLVRYWDYMPDAERKTRFSWGDYEAFDGLTLATEREVIADGPKRRIYFTDIRVERK